MIGLSQSAKLPPPQLQESVERGCGKQSASWVAPGFGLSAAHRFCVRFSDGSGAFVKAATDPWTERQLRVEHLVLSTVRGEHMPSVLAWIDEPAQHFPVLITEDLSSAYWPASHEGVVWRAGQFEALFSGIRSVTSMRAPEALDKLHSRVHKTWAEIATSPEPFLRLGLCSEEWYQQVIDALICAEQEVVTAGETLLHGDVRSDNVCFRGSGVVFVDWAEAMRGNPAYDLACVLPTLHLEGGPRPFEVFPDGGEWAALLSGMLAKRACTDHSAPHWLFNVFKRLVAIQLEWAAASLRLPQVAGTNWREI